MPKKILTDIMANVSGGWNYSAPGGHGGSYRTDYHWFHHWCMGKI